VRDSEREVKAILAAREKQEHSVTLVTPYTDITRERRTDSDEEEETDDNSAPDYLAPFLPASAATRALTRQEALDTREACLRVRARLTVPSFWGGRPGERYTHTGAYSDSAVYSSYLHLLEPYVERSHLPILLYEALLGMWQSCTLVLTWQDTLLSSPWPGEGACWWKGYG
jgi:hypothetical protein